MFTKCYSLKRVNKYMIWQQKAYSYKSDLFKNSQ